MGKQYILLARLLADLLDHSYIRLLTLHMFQIVLTSLLYFVPQESDRFCQQRSDQLQVLHHKQLLKE